MPAGGAITRASILHAQRSAGNHAVTLALAGGPAAHNARALARALVDFGVQAHIGARPGADGGAPTPVVASLDIGGRPHGLFGSKHRSHTTAWVVFCDVVRTAVLYQPLPEAITRLQALIDEALELPGAAEKRLEAMKEDIQVTGSKSQTGRDIYDRAKQEAETAKTSGTSALQPEKAGTAVAAIQDLAAAYLQLRNATPLSVTHDVTVAQGHGESGTRGGLRAAEREDDDERRAAAADKAGAEITQALEEAASGRATVADTHVRELLWKLLDMKAVGFLVGTEPSMDSPRTHSPVPGNVPAEFGGRRLADTVAQHLLTIRRAYPALYRRADMDSEDSLRGVLGDAADAPVEEDGKTVLADIRQRLGQSFTEMTPGDATGVQGIAPALRGAVQILVDTDGTPSVKTLRIGSRPTGILGSDEGAHLTAFGLVVEGLKRVIEGAPLAHVPDRVEVQLGFARELPTAKRQAELSGEAATRYATADQAVTTMLAAAKSTAPTDPAYVAVLQELLAAFLRYRNTLPLAATSEGGVPGGKAEGHALAILRGAEKQYAAAESGDQGAMEVEPGPEVLDAMWALIDSAAVGAISRSISKIMAPGIRVLADDDEAAADEPLLRIGDLVDTHVRTVKQAFPKCAAKQGLAGKDSLIGFLTGELPRGGTTEAAQARQDDALALPDADAQRVAEYIQTGTLPPATMPEDQPERWTSPRARKRTKLAAEDIPERDWRTLEEAEEAEEALIDRSARPPRRGKRKKLKKKTTTS
jgi:hypothetical protein